MLVKIYPVNPSEKELDKVVDVLRRGGVIIYPTDSIYAFGCSLHSPKAIERLRTIKAKSEDSLSVIFDSISSVSEYCRVDNLTFKLMKRNLPGAFTFILPTGSRLPKIFKHRKEVGIRMPDHPIIREICQLLDAPILTTTLPLEDGEDIEYITTPELIEEKFGGKSDLIIDGGIGDTEPSTVVSCMEGEAAIIRQGKGWLEE